VLASFCVPRRLCLSLQSKIAIPFRAPYAASKHAAQAFYDTLRSEVAIHKVYVTTVNPAYIKTNLSLNALCGEFRTLNSLSLW